MNKAISKKDLPYKSKGDLTTGSVVNHLIRLSIPMVWGIFSIISVQIVDVYFISRLGTEELAAISFVFPVILVLTHLSFGSSIAIASVISRLIGEKKQDDVKRVVKHGLALSFTAAAILASLSFIIAKPLFAALGADDAAYALIQQYFPYWLLSFVVMAIPVNGNSALRASGDAVRPAIVMVSVALTNLILDPLLIFGYFGFPELGIQGAALATLCAYVFGTCLGLFFLTRRDDLIAFGDFKAHLLKDSLKRLVVIAIPAGITNIIVPLTSTVIVGALAMHGTAAVAAHGIVNRVEAFALIAVISIAVGMTPVIGQNWGAQLFDRVHKTLNIAIGFNMIWSLSVAAILYIFAQPIAAIFSDDENVVRIAVMFFHIVPWSYAFGNLVLGWSSAFNAMGRPMRSLAMMLTHATLLMSSALISNYYFGIQGLFCAIATTNVVAGLFFHFLSWRNCLQSEQSA